MLRGWLEWGIKYCLPIAYKAPKRVLAWRQGYHRWHISSWHLHRFACQSNQPWYGPTRFIRTCHSTCHNTCHSTSYDSTPVHRKKPWHGECKSLFLIQTLLFVPAPQFCTGGRRVHPIWNALRIWRGRPKHLRCWAGNLSQSSPLLNSHYACFRYDPSCLSMFRSRRSGTWQDLKQTTTWCSMIFLHIATFYSRQAALAAFDGAFIPFTYNPAYDKFLKWICLQTSN